MGILFICYRRTIFIFFGWFHRKSTVRRPNVMVHNSNSNEQTKSASSTVWCAFGIDSYLTSSAAQHCIAYYTKQTHNKRTQQASGLLLLLLSIDRSIDIETNATAVRTYRPVPCYFTTYYHALILPFFHLFSFSFLSFRSLSPFGIFRSISIDRLITRPTNWSHDRQHTHTRRTSQQ